MSWKEYCLEDVANFQNGYAFRSKDLKLERDENDLPIFKMGNIEVGGGFKEHGRQSYIDSELASGLEKHLTKDFDILMSMTDMKGNVRLLGHSAQLINHEPFLVNQRVGHIRPKDHIDKRFLYYYLNSTEYINEIRKTAHAGVQVNLSSEAIRNSVVNLPALPIQRRIASILSAYDDLIENNLKRIKLLEEAAQNIYREWFVEMRFPDHEKVEWYSDEQRRRIPTGWTFERFSDVVDINPRTTPVKDKEAPYVPMASISESSMVIDPLESRVPKGGSKFVNGDTLFARITPCLENGKTGFVQCLEDGVVATGSTEFIVFRSTYRTGKYFIYLTSRLHMFRENAIKSMTGSDGRQRVKSEAFDQYFVNFPDEQVMDNFETLVEPFFMEVRKLVLMNQKLKEARDILLPRLMNQTIIV